MPLTNPRWQQFAQTIHDAPPVLPERIDYAFKIVDSGRELLQAFELLYHEYLQAGYVCQSASELLFTKHHLLPETTVFVAKAEDAVLSTATVVRDCREFGLPMDDLFEVELNALRKRGRRILEICSLASDGRKLSRKGVQNFIKLIFLYCIFLDVDDVCIMVNPRHVGLYTNLFGFMPVGEQKYYPRVNAPAVPMRVDVQQSRENLGRKCFTFSYREHLHSRYLALKIALCDKILCTFQAESHKTPPLNPLDACLLGHMLSVKSEVLQSLSAECRKILKSCYPGLCLETF